MEEHFSIFAILSNNFQPNFSLITCSTSRCMASSRQCHLAERAAIRIESHLTEFFTQCSNRSLSCWATPPRSCCQHLSNECKLQRMQQKRNTQTVTIFRLERNLASLNKQVEKPSVLNLYGENEKFHET